MRSALWTAFATAVLIGGGGALAASGSSDVALTTSTLPALRPGQTAWVSTLWRGAGSDAGSFVLRASGPAGISISYPANTGTYSSLYKEATLLADDTDYAAFKVVVGPDVVGDQTIALTVSYVLGGSGGDENGKGKEGEKGEDKQGEKGSKKENGKGKSASKSVVRNLAVILPVVAATGPAAEQLTTSVGPIKSGAAEYVEISFKGVKLGLTGVSVTVTSKPAGLSVTYPGDRSSAGLGRDSTLDVDETDSAAIRLDTAKLAPGRYQLGLDFAYGGGQRLPGTLTLVVS